MSNNSVRAIIVLLTVVAVVAVNGLANALPLNGKNTGEISDRFDVLFVPAGYVFAIWGLIYLGLFAYGFYQLRAGVRDNPRLRSIDGPFLISSAANIAWIFLWHYERFPLTLIAMLILLASLLVIYRRLGIGRADVPTGELWSVHRTFSVYLGWITVATIANISQVLVYLSWGGFGISAAVWTVVMLAVGVVLAWTMARVRSDIAYLLVLIWAFVGIAVKQTDVQLVMGAAALAAGLVALMVLADLVRIRRMGGAVTVR